MPVCPGCVPAPLGVFLPVQNCTEAPVFNRYTGTGTDRWDSAARGMHQALVLLAVSCSAYQGGDQADRWPAPTQTKRIKVQHLSPFVGRHNGGLLVNVTGKGVPSARPLSLV